jgi:hypothetical protein
MSSAVIYRILWRRKAWIGESADGDRNMRLFVTFLGVEQVRSADGAEPEPEPGSLVADTNILGRGTRNLVWNRKAG